MKHKDDELEFDLAIRDLRAACQSVVLPDDAKIEDLQLEKLSINPATDILIFRFPIGLEPYVAVRLRESVKQLMDECKIPDLFFLFVNPDVAIERIVIEAKQMVLDRIERGIRNTPRMIL